MAENRTKVFEVDVPPYPGLPPQTASLDPSLAQDLQTARKALSGRTVWHVNSTCDGGGVAELLYGYLRRHNALDIPTRWLVADAMPEFFAITKRIYFKIYGTDRDTEPFTAAEQTLYAEITREHAAAVAQLVRPGDVVVLHDPQTIGMTAVLRAAGVTVVWQCHLGSLTPNLHTAEAWKFLAPYLDLPHGYVFSHLRYVPSELHGPHTRIILPAIDPHSPKNRELQPDQVLTVLAGIGLTAAHTGPDTLGAEIGRPAGWLSKLARVEHDQPLPPQVPVVLQVSRWDTLKDMAGVLSAYAAEVAPHTDAHLVLAGPDPLAIADDPGGVEVLQDVQHLRAQLPAPIRRRVHLVATAGDDLEGTAFVINALQRHAHVVTQKSIREGFGLTITEAMWKHKAVVAPAVGAIPEQIIDGQTGILLKDPLDLDGFGAAVRKLLEDPTLRGEIAATGQRHCAQQFLIDPQLGKYAQLFTLLCENVPLDRP
ncbi:glycosyltransferase [Nonomuraea sp. NPDC026600]|uniref:glycosyltransferase n=1 Tax=Nonomuraea sp. NPDC026600 TaxID=3155363 RepID=UPI0033D74918